MGYFTFGGENDRKNQTDSECRAGFLHGMADYGRNFAGSGQGMENQNA
jgi:hypothetical protein